MLTEEELRALREAHPARGPVKAVKKTLPKVAKPEGAASVDVTGKTCVITGTLSTMKRCQCTLWRVWPLGSRARLR